MSNKFRPAYRVLNDQEKTLIDDIKQKAGELDALLSQAPKNREQSLAFTNLEQAVMWAVKGITG